MFQLFKDILGSQIEAGVAFAGNPAGQGWVQGRSAEDVVISDEGLGVGCDEMDEFLGDEFADVAADDIVEDRFGDAAGIIFINGVEF